MTIKLANREPLANLNQSKSAVLIFGFRVPAINQGLILAAILNTAKTLGTKLRVLLSNFQTNFGNFQNKTAVISITNFVVKLGNLMASSHAFREKHVTLGERYKKPAHVTTHTSDIWEMSVGASNLMCTIG